MVFGGMELNVVAFAKEAGVLPYAGLILVAWSFGSLVAGAVTGAIIWRASPARRFRVGAILLTLSLLPLPFAIRSGRCPAADPQWHGYCANPDRIGWGDPVGGRSEPTDRGTCLNSTGMVTGVAAGAAAVGYGSTAQARRLASSLLL